MSGRTTNGGQKRKTHCHRGHDLADCYRRSDGSRECAACKREYERQRYARRGAA